MNNAFILNPDITLLTKYGYIFISGLEIDAITNEEQKIEVEKSFEILVEKYNLTDHYDTLLYICLVESNDAELRLRAKHYAYKNYNRIKELAQLLQLYNPGHHHKPNNIKVSSAVNTIKLTDALLIDWYGQTIIKAIEAQEFNHSEFGDAIFSLTTNLKGEIISAEQSLNYPVIEKLASQSMRKPGIRERNKFLSTFLLRVWNYIDNETLLTTEAGIRFSDNQLNFLFSVAKIFSWLDDIDFESDPKDYMSTLLINRISS